MKREYCTKCSRCRERAVVIATIPYEVQQDHDGSKYVVSIPDFTVPRCAKCGNISHDYQASEQISRAFRKKAGLLQPEEICSQREKLGLAPKALAEQLGISISVYESWENGGMIQSRSQDRLMRAFFALPDVRAMLAHYGIPDGTDILPATFTEPASSPLVAP